MPSNPSLIITAPGGTYARNEPNFTARSIYTLEHGMEVEMLGQSGEWYRISVPMFVHKSMAFPKIEKPQLEHFPFYPQPRNWHKADGAQYCAKMLAEWNGVLFDPVQATDRTPDQLVDQLISLGVDCESGMADPIPPYIAQYRPTFLVPVHGRGGDRQNKKPAYSVVLEVGERNVILHDPCYYSGGEPAGAFRTIPRSDWLSARTGIAIWARQYQQIQPSTER